MIFQNLIKPKRELVTIPEDATLADALTILEDTGYRCVPILDKSGKIFRGNIYKMHIYRHQARGGSLQVPVTQYIKNATKFVRLDSAFFNVFFSLRDLPYIAVLDENNYFYGILTHNRFLKNLSEAWNVDNGSYSLAVKTNGDRGDLVTISKIITKFTVINSCVSLDHTPADTVGRILYLLPASVDAKRLQKIVRSLQRHGYAIDEIQDLTAS